jgi:hypothetical protein
MMMHEIANFKCILTLYFKLPAVFKTFFLEDGVLGLAGQVFPCGILPNNK